jgi:hypothetical protein
MVRHLLSPVVTRAVAAVVFGCTLLLLPARASAQDAAASGASNALGQGFGAQGQLVISSEMNAGFRKTNHQGWVANIKPAADYFIVPSISVGAAIGVAIGDNSAKGFEVGARVGYNLNVTEHVGAWPIVGIAYSHASASGGFSTSSTFANLYVPVLYHVIPHVFVGIGPFYDVHLAGDGNHSYGVRSIVGGWF